MKLREPARLPNAYYLILRRVDTRETVRIAISAQEFELHYDACEAKVRAEGRLPAGRWEQNTGGVARMGGVWTFQGTANGDLEPGDGHLDPDGKLIINVGQGAPLLEAAPKDWFISRNTNGLTLRRRRDNQEPRSISLEDGELVVKDAALVSEDNREGR